MSQTPISNGMPFNLDDLIHRRAIEGNRVEFKATWNRVIEPEVVQTVCAFANDLLNLNGGYIVLGVEENEGRPVLPPRGLDDLDLDLVQKEVHGACARISPSFQPLLFPGDYQGKAILVIWAPGGDNRPYQASDSMGKNATRDYDVRQGTDECCRQGGSLPPVDGRGGERPVRRPPKFERQGRGYLANARPSLSASGQERHSQRQPARERL